MTQLDANHQQDEFPVSLDLCFQDKVQFHLYAIHVEVEALLLHTLWCTHLFICLSVAPIIISY